MLCLHSICVDEYLRVQFSEYINTVVYLTHLMIVDSSSRSPAVVLGLILGAVVVLLVLLIFWVSVNSWLIPQNIACKDELMYLTDIP